MDCLQPELLIFKTLFWPVKDSNVFSPAPLIVITVFLKPWIKRILCLEPPWEEEKRTEKKDRGRKDTSDEEKTTGKF